MWPPVTSGFHEGFSSDEFEPVAEALRGFRAFLVDTGKTTVPDGRDHRGTWDVPVEGGVGLVPVAGVLRGVFKREYAWGTGANNAVCLAMKRAHPQFSPPPHDQIIAACDCGFWAYTNGDHLLSVDGPAVLGVVEGWGRLVIGPDGFRAQKARIAALCFPRWVTKGDPPWLSTWVRGLKAGPPTPSTFVHRSSKPWERVTPELERAVKQRYADVPTFTSVAAMQQQFPLSDLTKLVQDDEH